MSVHRSVIQLMFDEAIETGRILPAESPKQCRCVAYWMAFSRCAGQANGEDMQCEQCRENSHHTDPSFRLVP